jgi:transposase
VPESARGVLQVLVRTLNALEEQLKELDGEITRRAKADPVARRLMTIPGHRPDRRDRDHRPGAGAGGLPRRAGLRGLARADAAAEVDRGQAQARGHLEDGRAHHPPPAHPGRQRRGPVGRSAWAAAGSWLARMLARKPRMLVTVALANKTARIVWALLVKGGTYKAPAVAA